MEFLIVQKKILMLNDDMENLYATLDLIILSLEIETDEEKIKKLEEEKEDIVHEIKEISYDIAIYRELLTQLYPPTETYTEEESYDTRYEVFVEGDYEK